MSEPLLRVDGVTRRFGGLVAVRALDMAITRGTVHGLIGPNGAGKSTAFDLISGLTTPSVGRILLSGRDITDLAVEERVTAGICRTFQAPRLFEAMTAMETVMTGCHRHGRAGVLASLFSLRAKARDEADLEARSRHLLARVGLDDVAHLRVSGLSYGKRRLLEIARALATEPVLLLLDEVTSGLNPRESEAVAALVRQLAGEGTAVVLVEHDMRFIMGLCERITVLNFGSRIAEGRADEIATDPAVVEAYLGAPRGAAAPRRERRRAVRLPTNREIA